MKKNIYVEKGYNNRAEYLLALAEENEMNLESVQMVADLLGPQEDFDGLPLALEDYVNMYVEG